jgi:FkbM family methyltransferase
MTKAERFQELTSTAQIRGELRTKAVRAATFAWAAGVGDFILRFGSTAVLARLVVPEHFGLVMMITAFTAMADQFRDLGLSTVTVQRKDITYEEVSNLFWINVTAGVLIAMIVGAAAPLLAAYYKEPRLIIPTCLLAANFVWGGLMVQHQALLARRLQLGSTSIVRLLSSVVSTALSVYLAWSGYGYWALVWREFVRSALLTVGMWVAFPWMPGLPSRKTNVWGLVTFGADLSLANIIVSISGAFDRLLLGRYWGATPVALYRQAYQLLVLPSEQLLSPVYNVTQPGLSMLQADPSRFSTFYKKILTIACVAAMPLSLFIAVYSADITTVMLGPAWTASAPLLLILSLSNFIKHPVNTTGLVLITQGRSRRYLMTMLVQNGAAILFMLIGVKWGTTGMAYADVATTFLLIPPRVYYAFKDSPVSVGAFFSVITRPAAASIAMAAVLLTVRNSMWADGSVATLAIGTVTAAIAFPVVWMFLPGGSGEVLTLIADIRSAVTQAKAKSRPSDDRVGIRDEVRDSEREAPAQRAGWAAWSKSLLRRTLGKYKNTIRQKILHAAFKRARIRKIADHWILAKGLDSQSLVIDLGAHKGIFAKQLTQLYQCKAYAIEANQELCASLQQQGIEAFNYAITSADRPTDFFISDNLEASSVSPNFQALWGVHRQTVVQGITFRTLLKELALTNKTIEILKVDIEGAELDLIESLADSDVRTVKQITVEFHDWLNKDLHAGTLAAIEKLAALGFASYTVTPHHNAAVEMLFLNRRLVDLDFKQQLNLWVFNRLAYLDYN